MPGLFGKKAFKENPQLSGFDKIIIKSIILMRNEFDTPFNIRPVFGDTSIIDKLKKDRMNRIETTKVTIDLKTLCKIGVEKNQALNLLERLINLKNKK